MTNAYQAGFTAAMVASELQGKFKAKSAVITLKYEDETKWREAVVSFGEVPGAGLRGVKHTCTTVEHFFNGVTIRFEWDGIKRPTPRDIAADAAEYAKYYTDMQNANRAERVVAGVGIEGVRSGVARPLNVHEAIAETVTDIKRAFDRLNKLKDAGSLN